MKIKIIRREIERQEELEFCKEAGFIYAQGYYIGKPYRDTDAYISQNKAGPIDVSCSEEVLKRS